MWETVSCGQSLSRYGGTVLGRLATVVCLWLTGCRLCRRHVRWRCHIYAKQHSILLYTPGAPPRDNTGSVHVSCVLLFWVVHVCSDCCRQQVRPGLTREQRSVVHIKKCRYLENSGCVGMCINMCKVSGLLLLGLVPLWRLSVCEVVPVLRCGESSVLGAVATADALRIVPCHTVLLSCFSLSTAPSSCPSCNPPPPKQPPHKQPIRFPPRTFSLRILASPSP